MVPDVVRLKIRDTLSNNYDSTKFKHIAPPAEQSGAFQYKMHNDLQIDSWMTPLGSSKHWFTNTPVLPIINPDLMVFLDSTTSHGCNAYTLKRLKKLAMWFGLQAYPISWAQGYF